MKWPFLVGLLIVHFLGIRSQSEQLCDWNNNSAGTTYDCNDKVIEPGMMAAIDNETSSDDDMVGINNRSANQVRQNLRVDEEQTTTEGNAELTTEENLVPNPGNTNETFNEYISIFLSNNPNAKVIQTPNYPNPYPPGYFNMWSILVEGGTGIEVVLHDMDVDPLHDYLYFRGGMENSTSSLGPTLTGRHSEPIKFKILQTNNLYLIFSSDPKEENEHKGFYLTYAPFGEIRTTTTTTTLAPTIPTSRLQTSIIHLYVDTVHQNIDTWNNFKEILAGSANKYALAHNLSLDEANATNVIFLSITSCPLSWPNRTDCIRISYAIPLEWRLTTNRYYIRTNDESEEKYQLNTTHLNNMWDEYGAADFQDRGIFEYKLPDFDEMVILWSGISVGIVLLFLIVLYSIWKMDLFRDYHLMSTKADDQKTILTNRSEIDISMFPSPHQIVPTLFPSNEPMAGGIPYDYESHPITYIQSDFPEKSRNPDDKLDRNTSNYEAAHQPPSVGVMFAPIRPGNFEPKITPGFSQVEKPIYTKSSPSPRTKHKMLLRGMSTNESMS